MKVLSIFVFAILFAVPAATPAQTPQTPGSRILVTECNPHVHVAANTHPWIDPYGVWHRTSAGFPYWDAFLGIVYQNTSSQVATEIEFGLISRGSLVAIAKDVGTFSPGVKIDHEFVVSREIFPLGTAIPHCAVLRVKYADGTRWENPAPPEAFNPSAGTASINDEAAGLDWQTVVN